MLSESEIRVLGSLIEKELTTPEYYPLSLNALVNACNQKTNRDPVTSYSDCIVQAAADSLSEKGLVKGGVSRDSRVVKYDHYFGDEFKLNPAEIAVMCVLMLRGPQTAGELRQRTERMYAFEEIADVEAILDGLAERDEPLVVKLPRQPGRKEHRYAHLLAGEITVDDSGEVAASGSEVSCVESARICQLQQQLSDVRSELEQLREQFLAFKKEFE
jgi:uncharacterized protein YceH (UPF0502 family)